MVFGGYGYGCVVRIMGELACWGVLNGMVSGSGVQDKLQVINMFIMGAYKMVGIGTIFFCVVSMDDKVVCWGNKNKEKFEDLFSFKVLVMLLLFF